MRANTVGKTVGMMMILAFAAVLSSGCAMATSRPLYDAKRDAIFDPRLVGRWVADDANLTFSRGEGNSYKIDGLTDPAATDGAQLAGHLVRIGKYNYLFFADASKPEQGTTLFPCFRVTLDGEQLRLAALNVGAIASDLKAHPLALQHAFIKPVEAVDATQPAGGPQPVPEPVVGNIVLTDDPQAIRDYFVRHQDDVDWVTDAIVLHKLHEFSRMDIAR